MSRLSNYAILVVVYLCPPCLVIVEPESLDRLSSSPGAMMGWGTINPWKSIQLLSNSRGGDLSNEN